MLSPLCRGSAAPPGTLRIYAPAVSGERAVRRITGAGSTYSGRQFFLFGDKNAVGRNNRPVPRTPPQRKSAQSSTVPGGPAEPRHRLSSVSSASVCKFAISASCNASYPGAQAFRSHYYTILMRNALGQRLAPDDSEHKHRSIFRVAPCPRIKMTRRHRTRRG